MTLETLTEAVREMRTQQKRFFKAKPGTQERQEALDESRRTEARVDNLLKEETQESLFGEEVGG